MATAGFHNTYLKVWSMKTTPFARGCGALIRFDGNWLFGNSPGGESNAIMYVWSGRRPQFVTYTPNTTGLDKETTLAREEECHGRQLMRQIWLFWWMTRCERWCYRMRFLLMGDVKGAGFGGVQLCQLQLAEEI
ncbi:hypothetical protein Zmor_019344 [Zophobas morio]|uniref:Uncharacterized protein n=1 Tax=Zophobas morio TaxID=2755281 RepID=A0AA38M8P5_9CUCU|nr:hypothetical protein Zmor_019344 [Zophobas morio]